MSKCIHLTTLELFEFGVIMKGAVREVCVRVFLLTSVFIFIGSVPEMEMMSHLISIQLTLSETAKLFSKLVVTFNIPASKG